MASPIHSLSLARAAGLLACAACLALAALAEGEEVRGTNPAHARMVLLKGAWLYQRNCAFCHDKEGRGAVGPNLTDWYFLNGSERADLRRVIAEGVPEKGMPGWTGVLPPVDLRLIEHYVWSLRGRELRGREPQGERHDPEAGIASSD